MRRHQANEFRVSVRFPSGNVTSKKFSHLSAALKFLNRTLDTTEAAVDLERRQCEPWVSMPVPIPPNRKWQR